MCVGLALIFGVMRVINFAQGDFLMLGMYVTLYIVTRPRRFAVWGRALRGPFIAAVLRRARLCSWAAICCTGFLVSRVTGIRASRRRRRWPLRSAHSDAGRLR